MNFFDVPNVYDLVGSHATYQLLREGKQESAQMDIKITTANLNVSVALKVINLFKDGNYPAATNALFDILDAEPDNWQARLLLGVCQFRAGNVIACQRTFQYIDERCPDQYIKRKAQKGLDCIQVANSVKNVRPGVDVKASYAYLDEEMREYMGLVDAAPQPKTKPWGGQWRR